jgi:hypothetical protein
MQEGYLYCSVCKKEYDLETRGKCSCGGALRSYFVCPACQDEFLLDNNGIATRIDDGKTEEVYWANIAGCEVCLACVEQVESYGSTLTRYDTKFEEKKEGVLFNEWYGRILFPEPSEELPAWFTRIYKGVDHVGGWRGYDSPKLNLTTLADGWYTESGDSIGKQKALIYEFSEWLKKQKKHPIIYLAFDKTSNCMSVLCRIMCTKGKEKQVITFLEHSPFTVAALESALF